jgi:hypothetical protein
MNAYLMPGGGVLIPLRAEADGAVGDGFAEVPADDPRAAAWRRWYGSRGETMPEMNQGRDPQAAAGALLELADRLAREEISPEQYGAASGALHKLEGAGA